MDRAAPGAGQPRRRSGRNRGRGRGRGGGGAGAASGVPVGEDAIRTVMIPTVRAVPISDFDRASLEDVEFAASDPHHERLLGAAAERIQLYPPSPEDQREVLLMKERCAASVAECRALADGYAGSRCPEEAELFRRERGELAGLASEYVEYLTAGPREMEAYERVLSDIDSVLKSGVVQLRRDQRRMSAARAAVAARRRALRLPLRYCAVPYGSYVSGLCSPHGDIDVSIELDPDAVMQVLEDDYCDNDEADEGDEFWSRLPEKVRRTGSLSHLPKEDKVELLRKLLRELERRGLVAVGRPGGAQLRLGARVPIIKIVHASTGIKCDVSVGAHDSRAKSEAVGIAARRCVSSPDGNDVGRGSGSAESLVRLAKAWARTAGVADAASAGLNSFSITLLVLFFLQAGPTGGGHGRVAPLRELMGLGVAEAEATWETSDEEGYEDGDFSYRAAVDHPSLPDDRRRPHAAGHGEPAQTNSTLDRLRRNAERQRRRREGRSGNGNDGGREDALLSALGDFLAFLHGAMTHWRESPRARARVRASVWEGKFTSGAWGTDRRYSAGIEDPFDFFDNCARALGERQRDRVAERAAAAAVALGTACPCLGAGDGGAFGGRGLCDVAGRDARGETFRSSLGTLDGVVAPAPDAREAFRQVFGSQALATLAGRRREQQQREQQRPVVQIGGARVSFAAPAMTAARATPPPGRTQQQQHRQQQQEQHHYHQEQEREPSPPPAAPRARRRRPRRGRRRPPQNVDDGNARDNYYSSDDDYNDYGLSHEMRHLHV